MTIRRIDDPAFPSIVTVGCANFQSLPRDKAATVEKLIGVVRVAARQGCDLVVFPELAIDTWDDCPDCARAHGPCAWHLAAAETADGPASAAIARVARELGIHVIYGFEERDPDDPGILYNAAAVVAPDGLLGTYRKLHLGIPLETDRFTPGRRGPTGERGAVRFVVGRGAGRRSVGRLVGRRGTRNVERRIQMPSEPFGQSVHQRTGLGFRTHRPGLGRFAALQQRTDHLGPDPVDELVGDPVLFQFLDPSDVAPAGRRPPYATCARPGRASRRPGRAGSPCGRCRTDEGRQCSDRAHRNARSRERLLATTLRAAPATSRIPAARTSEIESTPVAT